MERALINLAAAEANYRHAHDLRGDDHKETGRAWDAMRRAGDAARDMIAQTRAARTEKDAEEHRAPVIGKQDLPDWYFSTDPARAKKDPGP